MRPRTSRRSALRLGAWVILGCLPLASGCGDSSQATGQMETSKEEVQAQQDAMRANMEKAYSRPDTKKAR